MLFIWVLIGTDYVIELGKTTIVLRIRQTQKNGDCK